MSLSYDNTTTFALPSTATSGTSSFSHTCTTASDRLLLVAVALTSNNGSAPSSVTYGGVSMTLVNEALVNGNNCAVRVYRLIAPATGANNVAIAWQGTTNRGGAVAISYSGVNQTTPVTASTVESGGDSSIAVTSASTETVIDFIAASSGDSCTFAVGAGQTERANYVGSSGATGNACRIAVSTEQGTSSTIMSWTRSGGSSPSHVGVSIQPASTGLSITSVTPSSFDDGRTGIVIAGSGFGASQGSSTLTIGGQAQTVTAWSDTSITFTSVRGSNSMGARSLTITRA